MKTYKKQHVEMFRPKKNCDVRYLDLEVESTITDEELADCYHDDFGDYEEETLAEHTADNWEVDVRRPKAEYDKKPTHRVSRDANGEVVVERITY